MKSLYVLWVYNHEGRHFSTAQFRGDRWEDCIPAVQEQFDYFDPEIKEIYLYQGGDLVKRFTSRPKNI